MTAHETAASPIAAHTEATARVTSRSDAEPSAAAAAEEGDATFEAVHSALAQIAFPGGSVAAVHPPTPPPASSATAEAALRGPAVMTLGGAFQVFGLLNPPRRTTTVPVAAASVTPQAPGPASDGRAATTRCYPPASRLHAVRVVVAAKMAQFSHEATQSKLRLHEVRHPVSPPPSSRISPFSRTQDGTFVNQGCA